MFAAGPVLPLNLGSSIRSDAQAGVVLAVRGGVLFNRTELALEVAPMSQAYSLDHDPVVWLGASAGHYFTIPTLSDIVPGLYWPLRAGVGAWVGNTPLRTPMFVGRADIIALAYQMEPVLLELNAPTFRVATEFDTVAYLEFKFGVGGTYLF